MPLPWVRLDSTFAQHDKVLALLADPSRLKWQACAVFPMALGWSAASGTDGWLPAYSLPAFHCTPGVARLLVKYGFWTEGVNGWQIVNYAERQELEIVTEAKRAAKELAGQKGNCVRWHGPKCWVPGQGCSREVS